MTDFQHAEPHIYTSRGNLPLSALRYVHKREDTPGNIVFVEEYFLGDESVKRSVHVLPVIGICLVGVTLPDPAAVPANLPAGFGGVQSAGVAADIS